MKGAKLTRREVIERAMYGAGFATVAGSTLLAACSSEVPREQAAQVTAFSLDNVAWLDEVAETILPETSTPGARAAQVGGFIALMVNDTYSPKRRARFNEGMTTLEAECRAEAGVGFLAATAEQRLTLLQRLDKEAIDYLAQAEVGAEPHYFRMLKELTVLGYFTSEIGYTQAMRYLETPGRFDPCVDYKTGETTWAQHA